jgi:hypothetical protein
MYESNPSLEHSIPNSELEKNETQPVTLYVGKKIQMDSDMQTSTYGVNSFLALRR